MSWPWRLARLLPGHPLPRRALPTLGFPRLPFVFCSWFFPCRPPALESSVLSRLGGAALGRDAPCGLAIWLRPWGPQSRRLHFWPWPSTISAPETALPLQQQLQQLFTLGPWSRAAPSSVTTYQGSFLRGWAGSGALKVFPLVFWGLFCHPCSCFHLD